MRPLEEIVVDMNSAIEVHDAQVLLQIAAELQTLGSPESEALQHRCLGWAADSNGNYAQALEHYRTALDAFSILGNRMDEATVAAAIGNVCSATGQYTQALEHYQRALDVFIELDSRFGIATVTSNLGNVFAATGDFPPALDHYQRALEKFTELDHLAGIARVTGNLGNVYIDTGDYPQALEHYQQALELFTQLGNRASVARVTGNIGSVYHDTGDYTLALENFQNALDLYTELGNLASVATVTGNIGNVYTTIGNYPQAIEHFQTALNIHTELGHLVGIARDSGLLLTPLFQSGEFEKARDCLTVLDGMQLDEPVVAISRERGRARLQDHDGDIDDAMKSLQTALGISKDRSMRSATATTYQLMRELAQKQNDFPAYIEYNNEYTRVNEEIRGADAKLKIAMQAKEREIAEREKEHQKHMAVLHSTLPKHIADRVARGEVVNDKHDCVAVLFLDVVGFTTMSSSMDATVVVAMLERMFGMCDAVMNTHGLMKIKTIGDSYMAVAFDNIENAAHAALELASAITEVPVRIGIHCGPVVAGVLGKERMQYDVWGDTVNIASRMESTGEAGRVHLSEVFVTNITRSANAAFRVVLRGVVEVKGKGAMNTYWLEHA
ncbi:hypothetical protein BH10BAC6_BH10BAC6_05850 [soil metagenome]